MQKKTMTCVEYIELLYKKDGYGALVDELVHDGGCDTEELFLFTQKQAELNHVTLIDKNDFEYKRYFEELYQRVKKSMTCAQYAEHLDGKGGYSQIIDELYWSGGCDTKTLFLYTQKCAEADGIILIDVDEFEYDPYFWDLYQSSEKGLS